MALTALTGVTKITSQKTARQRSFSAKEAVADTAVAVPVGALKSVELDIEGVNDEGAFGTNTVGQKITGKLVMYAGDANIVNFAHELVTKVIEHVACTTNSGKSYVFQTADATPALSFAYEKAEFVKPTDVPTVITLLVTGYRDNLVMS